MQTNGVSGVRRRTVHQTTKSLDQFTSPSFKPMKLESNLSQPTPFHKPFSVPSNRPSMFHPMPTLDGMEVGPKPDA